MLGTEKGKVFGRDTTNGKEIWKWKISDPTISFKPLKFVVVKSASEGLQPEVAIVGEMYSRQVSLTRNELDPRLLILPD